LKAGLFFVGEAALKTPGARDVAIVRSAPRCGCSQALNANTNYVQHCDRYLSPDAGVSLYYATALKVKVRFK